MGPSSLSVIKIGGSTINDWDKNLAQLNQILDMGQSIIIVHGGGKTVSEWGSKLGIRPEFVKGLRKTDKDTLEVAISILSGLVNSKLVFKDPYSNNMTFDYSNINYTKNIKPAPSPYYTLNKFFGNLSIQEYRKLLQRKSKQRALTYGKVLARVIRQKAFGFYSKGELDNTILGFEEMLKIYQEIDDIKGQVPVYFSLGLLHEEKGNIKKAQEYFTRVLSINPNHIQAKDKIKTSN